MSTGIPKRSSRRRKNVVSLSFEGKLDTEEVLEGSFSSYAQVAVVNGDEVTNKLYYGDNLDVLRYLLSAGCRGSVKLVYIDPPFSTESVFVKRDQTEAYTDVLKGGDFVEFLRERLIILRELLADDGSIYLHLDGKMAFPMKIIMDEVFGEENCRAFITRKKCSTKNYTKKTYGNISDYIMFYSKTRNYVWNRPYMPWEMDRMVEEYPCIDEATGRRYKKVPVHAPGVRNGETGKPWRGKMPPVGKHWQYTPDKLDALDAAGEIYWSSTGNPRRKVFCDPLKGVPVQDIWLNYRDSVNQALKTTGYPTEKNIDMLNLIVSASSNEGDLVMDCFAGSGTTLDAAFTQGRTWIGVDSSPESIRAIVKRFCYGLEAYGDYVGDKMPKDAELPMAFDEKCSFGVYCQEGAESELQEIVFGQ